MLAGEPPYQGSSAQAIVAKVITEKAPPVTAARDTVPGHVAAAIARALQKMPADRFKTAAAFADALTNTAFTAPTGTVATGIEAAPEAARRTVPTWLFAATAVLAVAAVALLGLRSLAGGSPAAVTRFTVELGDELPIASTNFDRIDISPDGSRLAMLVSAQEAQMAIAVRAMDQLDVTVVPRTDNARNPVFSPDNEWLAFRQNGAIRKIRLAGGTPLTLAEGAGWTGVSWGKDGTIVFVAGGSGGLRRIPEAGGPVDTLTTPDGEGHSWPYQLPNGRGVLFTVGTSNDDSRIAVVDIASGAVTELLEGVRARYVATGYLVYASADGGVLAAPFDQDRLEVVGPAVPLLEGVSVASTRSARFAVAGNGTLVYQTGGAGAGGPLVRVERDGAESVVVDAAREYNLVRYSPDGSRVAVQLEDDIWIHDVVGGTATRLTVEGSNQSPVWSPDGGRVAFGSQRDGGLGVWWRAVDGSTPAERLVETRFPPHPGGWTPDGRRLVYRQAGEGTARDLWALTLEGDSGAAPYLATEFEEAAPVLSPDGRWLAYVSNETGRYEVYVRAFPASGGRIPVSTEGGFEPLWSRDGTELYYRSGGGGGGSLVAAEVELTPTFRVVRRAVLFNTPGYRWRFLVPAYDVHPDGSFLFMKMEGGGTSSTMVVLNWFEELKEAVAR
jgi:serine/threonine-protein kinase